MFCSNCGKEIGKNDTYCTNCGAPVHRGQYQDNSYDRSIPESISDEKESGFDTFMYKTFYANGKLSYEKAGKSYVIGILIVQILQFICTILKIDAPFAMVTLIFVLLDWYSLSKRGIKGIWKIWGILITPVYLWIRARKTDRKYFTTIISTIIVVITLAGSFAGTRQDNNSTTTSVPNNTVEKTTNKVNLNDTWYESDLWYRGTTDTSNIIHIKEDNYNNGEYWLCSAYSVICQFYPDSASEITDDNLGQGIRYVYDDDAYRIVLDYFPNTNQILLVMPLGSPYTGTKYDYSDLYAFDTDLTQKSQKATSNSSSFESHNYDEESLTENDNDTSQEYFDMIFYDGWNENNLRFECFETNNGDDVIINFYEENGDIMMDISGEQPIPIYYNDVYEGYEAYPEADGESHIIIQAVSSSEIEFSSSGHFGDYGGTYIELPDSIEE